MTATMGPEAEERRLRMIEEAQTKIWSNIVKRDVPRVSLKTSSK